MIHGTTQETINSIRKDLAQGPLESLSFQILWESYPGVDEAGESTIIVRIKCDPEEEKKIKRNEIDLPNISYAIRKSMRGAKVFIIQEAMRYI